MTKKNEPREFWTQGLHMTEKSQTFTVAQQAGMPKREDIAACLSQLKLERFQIDGDNPDDQEMGVTIVGHSRAVDKIMAVIALAAQPPAAPVETEEWEEVTDGTTKPGDRFSYIPNPETGVGQITSHKRRVQRSSAATGGQEG